jgi:hypothetical protein
VIHQCGRQAQAEQSTQQFLQQKEKPADAGEVRARLFPDETFPLYAVDPSCRQPPAKVRAFVDFALRAVR